MTSVVEFALTVSLLLASPLSGAAQVPTISTYAGGGVTSAAGQASAAYVGQARAVIPDGGGGFYLASALEVYHVGADGSIQLRGAAFGLSGSQPLLPPDLTDLALDAEGNLYISSFYAVHKLSTEGALTIVAGGGGPLGDGGPATSASLSYVTGIALDRAGDLYIADSVNHRVRKVTGDGLITTIAGNGLAGSDGDGGPATSARVQPKSVAIDAAGNIYIGEPNRVRKVTAGIINSVAGTGVDGHSGDGGPATAAQIRSIGGVAVDAAGNLYIAEFSGHAIRRVTAGGMITTVAGTTVQGYNGDGLLAAAAQLNFPSDVAVDSGGSYYIADTGNLRVRKVGADGVIRTVAGRPGSPGDGSAATAVSLDGPTGVALDSAGNLYIADARAKRIRKVNTAGLISTLAGGGASNREGAPAWEASFRLPFGVAVDSQGRVYIADGQDSRVRSVALDGTIRTIAGTGTSGSSGDGGPATSARLAVPLGLKLDASGNLYILDTGNFTIRKVTADGVIQAFARAGSPADIAFDSEGNAYIADNQLHVVDKLTAAGVPSRVAGTPLVPGYSGDGGPATAATLNGPVGLAFDNAGNLYVSEARNHVIRKITPDGMISTVAGTGIAGFSGDGGPAASAQLRNPGFIALDPQGNMYVADRDNNRIRKIEGLAPSGARPFSIPELGGVSWSSVGDSSARTSVGYARITPAPGTTTPSGLAILGLRQNGVLISEAGVPASPLIRSGRLYAEIDNPVNTGVAIANPSNEPATIAFYFVGTNGKSGDGTTTIPANGQISTFLDQAPFNAAAPLHGTFTFSSSVPVAVVALRGFINERGEFLMTTLPVSDLSAPGTAPLTLPHFASGGGWTTQIELVNPTDSLVVGTLEFLDPSGVPMTVEVNGLTGSRFTYAIPVRDGQQWKISGMAETVQVGSIRTIPATGNISPAAIAVFSFRVAGVTVSEAGVPAMSMSSAFQIYVEASGDFDHGASGAIQTGLAVSNLSNAEATVTLRAYRLDGTSIGSLASLVIPPNGNVAKFLNQIAGLADIEGQRILRISSASPISVIGLRGRYNERHDFLITTLPPVDEAAARSTAELLFPHFADAGGYTTQFILLGNLGAQPVSGTLRMFSPSGQPANLILQ